MSRAPHVLEVKLRATLHRNIAQVYDRTVALRNNYIPLTHYCYVSPPVDREGGAGVTRVALFSHEPDVHLVRERWRMQCAAET